MLCTRKGSKPSDEGRNRLTLEGRNRLTLSILSRTTLILDPGDSDNKADQQDRKCDAQGGGSDAGDLNKGQKVWKVHASSVKSISQVNQ